MIEALEHAAMKCGYKVFTCREFDNAADIKHTVILREYGSWGKAMERLAASLAKKNIILEPRNKPKRKDSISDREIFAEMERIWKRLGHRPSKLEWEAHLPTINYNTIYKHFGGWIKACSQFIEYKMDGSISAEAKSVPELPHADKEYNTEYRRGNNRTIPLGIRLKVLDRDNFRCVFCGKSPATDLGTRLHIDHIVPFSKGGKSILENLQTLCEECNLGKGDRHIE